MKTTGLTLREAIESGKPYKPFPPLIAVPDRWYVNERDFTLLLQQLKIDQRIVVDICLHTFILKQEPREIWLNEYNGGLLAMQHSSEDEAKESADLLSVSNIRQVKFREVIEGE